MSRHLVALIGEYQSFEANGELLHEGRFVFSGFVMSFQGRWFWTTAGHCLDEKFDREIRRGTLKILSCGFADYFGSGARSKTIVPYTYEVDCSVNVNKVELGLDFALIPLPDLIRRNLEHNGIIPVSRENWIHQKDLTFETYKMLGFPSHLVSNAGVRPVMITVNRMESTEVDSKSPPWFVGTLDDSIIDFDIVGMSGGPIYGFRQRQDGQWSYHVVALQSRWKDRRITFGCSVPLFAEAVHRFLAQNEDSNGS